MKRVAAARQSGALALAAAAAVLAAAPASAHTDLLSSIPRSGAKPAKLPAAITLEFTDPMSEDLARITLACGGRTARPLQISVDGSTVKAPVPRSTWGETQEPCSVGYRVVSADGHPVTGTYGFVAPRLPRAETQPTETPTETPGADPSASADPGSTPAAGASDGTVSDPSTSDGGVSWGLVVGGVALTAVLAGVVTFVLRRRSTGQP